MAWQFRVYGDVTGIYIVGSMCTKNWTPDSDIDVTIVMADISEDNLKQAQKVAVALSGRSYLHGTQHPINPYVRQTLVLDMFDAAYDVRNLKWLKQAQETDVKHKVEEFDSLIQSIDLERSQLHRDLIDYNFLMQVDPMQVCDLKNLLEARLATIDRDVKKLALLHQTLHFLRVQGFHRILNPLELAAYHSRNALPENVVYKLLERYHYTRYLQAVARALRMAGGAINTPGAAETLKKQIGELTGSGAAGPYEVPLGASTFRRKKKLRQIPALNRIILSMPIAVNK